MTRSFGKQPSMSTTLVSKLSHSQKPYISHRSSLHIRPSRQPCGPELELARHGKIDRMAHIGELPLCPATPAFPGRLCIAPSSVACALAEICAHASRVFGLLRSAVHWAGCGCGRGRGQGIFWYAVSSSAESSPSAGTGCAVVCTISSTGASW